MVLGVMLAMVVTVATAFAAVIAFTLLPTEERTIPIAAPNMSGLDMLRSSASLGDPWASRHLVDRLLDRYDLNSDENALVEAVVWFDRDWDTVEFLNSPLAARLMERQCAHPALRWHRLCIVGE